MNIVSGILNGRRTPRGVGVTRTVGCRMQAFWNDSLNGIGGLTLEVPNPPRLKMNHRHTLFVKYFAPTDPKGTFFLIERQTTSSEAFDRGYPIHGVAGPETRRQKRLKQIRLPLAGPVRIYSGTPGAAEFGSTFEFG